MPKKKIEATQRLVKAEIVREASGDYTDEVMPQSERPKIRYKGVPRKKLHPDEQTYSVIQALASYGMTQQEIAAVLIVHRRTLEEFMKKYPDARAAYDVGVELGRARLKSILWEQAEKDPAQARFLAKQHQWLNYTDSPKPDVSITVNANLAPEDRLKKIAELQQKVIDLTPIKEESNADD